MDSVWDKLVETVDGPLGLIAIILIFFVTKRLFSLEEWVRNKLSDVLEANTKVLTELMDNCRHKGDS
jgi:hypothetical protein